MIHFAPGTPTLRIDPTRPFHARLFEILRTVTRGASMRWTEAVHDAAPATVAHRRMLERLLLTYAVAPADGAGVPAWVSAGVRSALQGRQAGGVPAGAAGGRLAPPAARYGGVKGAVSPVGGPSGPFRGGRGGTGTPGELARPLYHQKRAPAPPLKGGYTPPASRGARLPGGFPPITVDPVNLPGIGAETSARIVVVGDRPGPGWGARMQTWPFISANRGGCSAWLADQLEAGGIGEELLYWINAYAQDSTPLPHAAVEELTMWRSTSTMTVALGRHAAAWCAAGGWGCAEVHHPQYWKRFHNGHAYHLVKLLRQHLST